MKKVAVILIMAVITIASLSMATSMSTPVNYAVNLNQTVGVGFPNYGWAIKNAEGQITGFQGFNVGLGYSAKYFFSPLKINAWNPFWEWGSVLVLIPYVGIGTDYFGADGFYFGIKLDDLIPGIEFGVMY